MSDVTRKGVIDLGDIGENGPEAAEDMCLLE